MDTDEPQGGGEEGGGEGEGEEDAKSMEMEPAPCPEAGAAAQADAGPGGKRTAGAAAAPAAMGGEGCDHRPQAGWSQHPNRICAVSSPSGDAKKFRLLLSRFLDLERPIVTTRMLAFLRQRGCIGELIRFIVRPQLAASEAVRTPPCPPVLFSSAQR
eukprot:COSAG01_NODE_13260_length_1609_cov_1.115079_1_plen_156_part_10